MKHIFIINPVAGKGKHVESLTTDIVSYFSSCEKEYEIHITKSQENCINFIKTKCEENIPYNIYACGGDGTLHDVINASQKYSHINIGVIPCGSGNDFVKNFKSSTNFLSIDKQVRGYTKNIDLIKVGNHFSISVCNIGFDADVAFNMHKFKKIPLISGHSAYFMSVLFCLLKNLGKFLEIEIDDNKTIKGNYLLAVVANGSTYGGGYNCAPNAIINDGLIDVCLIDKVSRFKILNLISKYKKGLHLIDEETKKICMYVKCKKVKIIKKDKIKLCIDGERVEMGEALFEIKKNLVNFIIPHGTEIIE